MDKVPAQITRQKAITHLSELCRIQTVTGSDIEVLMGIKIANKAYKWVARVAEFKIASTANDNNDYTTLFVFVCGKIRSNYESVRNKPWEILDDHTHTAAIRTENDVSADISQGSLMNAVFGGEKKEGIAKCISCNGDSVRFIQKQTRSADEGCTIFFSCNDCGHSWVRS